MLILGIETSCDETAAAVVEDGRTVRSSIVASQDKLHVPYGGVVPEIACRAHLLTVLPVVQEALREAGVAPRDLDAVAVSRHPGLIGALLIGLTAAKTFAWIHDLPLVGVNHLEAHAYAAGLDHPGEVFPAVCLVVSGGHTILFHSRGPREHERLGTTIDDAAGETFDKVASLLNLPYPGGPNIDRVAREGDRTAAKFPRSWLGKESLDFSFSGLKTAVLYHAHGSDPKAPRRELTQKQVADTAASFQEAVVDVLVGKAIRAMEQTGVSRVVVGGGVAANGRLRERLTEAAATEGFEVVMPPIRLCVDNAAMVAGVAWHQAKAGDFCGLDMDAMPTTRTPTRKGRKRDA